MHGLCGVDDDDAAGFDVGKANEYWVGYLNLKETGRKPGYDNVILFFFGGGTDVAMPLRTDYLVYHGT